jgi:hypothetical protein
MRLSVVKKSRRCACAKSRWKCEDAARVFKNQDVMKKSQRFAHNASRVFKTLRVCSKRFACVQNSGGWVWWKSHDAVRVQKIKRLNVMKMSRRFACVQKSGGRLSWRKVRTLRVCYKMLQNVTKCYKTIKESQCCECSKQSWGGWVWRKSHDASR